VHIKISSDGAVIERNVPFDELRKPNLLLGTLAGDFAGNLIEALDLPEFSSLTTSQNLEWQACRTRVRIGSDYVPIYRLETQLLGRDVVMDIGTLGEILRVQLPGDINAHIDEWSRQ
jgi:hypothetical protein